MATIPRTYKITSKEQLNSILPKNGQVIALWDTDAVYYDAPMAGNNSDTPVRRKISGVQVVSSLPDPTSSEAMEDIIYANIGDTSENPLYELFVLSNGEWLTVGSNKGDENVKVSNVSDDTRFYLVGTSNTDAESTGPLLKFIGDESEIYAYYDTDDNQSVVHADKFDGTVENATNAINATNALNATYASKDANNVNITDYIQSVNSSVRNQRTQLEFVNGEGTTVKSVDVENTTYSNFNTTTDGLVPAPPAPANEMILFGNGWQDKDDISIGTADKAIGDSLGNPITNYIKQLSYDTTTDTLTATLGDGTQSAPISIPNTEYEPYDGTAPGLVPQASSAQSTYYLRGDGTWHSVGDITYSVFDQDHDGLVPKPIYETGRFLKDDHSWDVPTDTKNTVGATASNSKLYITGATAIGTYGQSYVNADAYIQNGELYSKGLQVVNLGQPSIPYNVASAYAVGDTCIYQGSYYSCVQAISASAAQPYDETSSYAVNDLCIYDNVIYKCTTAIDYSAAANYDDSVSYTTGNLCFYPQKNQGDDTDGRTYICTQATTGDFDDECWDLISEFSFATNWGVDRDFDPDDWNEILPQAIYNKTYEGYKLGTACQGTLVNTTDITNDKAVPTTSAVNTAIDNIVAPLSSTLSDKAEKDSISSEYDDTRGYAVGEYCIYGDDLFICTSAQSVGDFDDTKWALAKVTDVLVRVPAPPTANGTYTLTATVSGGVTTFSWT